MTKRKLFVKTKKVEIAREFHGGAGPWENPHVIKSTEMIASPEDTKAKQILQKSSVDFELVDLSKGMGANLLARTRGIKETPTLRIEKDSVRLYFGLEAIAKYIDELQAPKRTG